MKTVLEQLREVIDTLTTVQKIDVRQEIDGEMHVAKATVEPLIGQLRNAIASSVAVSGTSSSLPSERNMLDSDALELYDRIEDEALRLLTTFSKDVPYLLPEQNIRWAALHIYKLHMDTKVTDEDVTTITRSLKASVSAINRVLNPPVTLELMGECPNCSQSHAKLNETDSGRALIVEWHNPDTGFSNALQNCFAKCRSCRAVWIGDLQLRELAYVLEAKETV